jgi:perosamine synthetase
MPIKLKDTVEEFWDIETIKYCLAYNPQYTSDDFFIEMSHFLGVKNKIWGMPSGRWALQHFLENTKDYSGEIVLAASFNCGEIGTAVQKAGFILETFDLMDPLGRIDCGNIVAGLKKSHHAIIVPHLFGVPTDFNPIFEKCQHLGILIIEDFAHALGGTIQGRMVGTLGDAAIFSFNHDKPLSLR